MRALFVSMAALAASMAGLTSAAHATSPEGVFGVWLTQSGNGQIEITPCGQSACGRILTGSGGGPNADTKNPDPALRSRPLIGLTILQGFQRQDAGWKNGRIYDPESGRTYRSEIALQADGKLAVKGCVGPVCQTQRWTRVR